MRYLLLNEILILKKVIKLSTCLVGHRAQFNLIAVIHAISFNYQGIYSGVFELVF